MKNLLKISVIVILLLFTLTQLSVYATITSGSIGVSTNSDSYKKGDTVVVTFKIASLNSTKGMITFGGTLEYDDDCLELVYDNTSEMYMVKGENGWSNPTYNPDNGMLVIDRGNLISSGAIFSATFKVLKEENTTITLKDISVADGEGKVSLGNASKEITFSSGDNDQNKNETNKNETNQNQTNKNETNQNETNRNETNQNQTNQNETSQNQVNQNETSTHETNNNQTTQAASNTNTNTNKTNSIPMTNTSPDTAVSSLPNAGINSIGGRITLVAILVIIVLAIIKYIQYKRINDK